MGCEISWSKEGVKVTGPTRLQAGSFDMNDMTDVVPTLAVCAMFAEGKRCISNVRHMRYKECDRLAVLQKELSKVGETSSSWMMD